MVIFGHGVKSLPKKMSSLCLEMAVAKQNFMQPRCERVENRFLSSEAGESDSASGSLSKHESLLIL